MAEWAIFARRAPDWEGFQRWPNSWVGVGDIGKWGCEGFVGV